jgi:hypothetical protein
VNRRWHRRFLRTKSGPPWTLQRAVTRNHGHYTTLSKSIERHNSLTKSLSRGYLRDLNIAFTAPFAYLFTSADAIHRAVQCFASHNGGLAVPPQPVLHDNFTIDDLMPKHAVTVDC